MSESRQRDARRGPPARHRASSWAAVSIGCGLWAVGLGACTGRAGELALLHVSYDSTRELFEDVNREFASAWAREHPGQEVVVRMSHGGSGHQARAVIEGLPADVVSLALAYDVDALAREGRLIDPGWQARLPDGGAPWTSTIVFVVRRGNPGRIHDWLDLVTGDVRVITANPKTSGGARWAYLAAYGFASRRGYRGLRGDEGGAAFVRDLYGRVPVLDSGARGSSTTFVRNGIGDVLLTWESEAHRLVAESPDANLEVVFPTESILAETPVAWVDGNVGRRGNRAIGEAYVRWLWSPEAQEIAARHRYRPRDTEVLARHRADFPEIRTFTVGDVAGDWAQAHRAHFADGALFDRLYRPGARAEVGR